MRGLNLKNESEWIKFCKGRLPGKGILPADIPISPRIVYAKQGWAGLGDWLGTEFVATRRRIYWPFRKARSFARKLSLKSQGEWFDFCKGKAPPNISATPHNTYAGKGWNGWGDWLGTNNVATYNRDYRKFENARTFVRSLGFKNCAEWQEFCKQSLPFDIPANPNRVYADKGWAGMGDWLGTGRIATHLRKYRSFQQARRFARSLGLSGVAEWRQFCKGVLRNKGSLPSDIPSKPDNRYIDEGWSGYADWLGTCRTRVSKSSKRKT